MAQKGIREYDAKRMLAKALASPDDKALSYNGRVVLVSPGTDMQRLPQDCGWLTESKLVVKPDQLFGKRGKNNLLLLDADWNSARKWIDERMNKPTTIVQNNVEIAGELTHFLIEPFIPHEKEYYVAITTEREGDVIHFSPQGGIDIESQWHTVKQLRAPVMGDIADEDLAAVLGDEDDNLRPLLAGFIKRLHRFFVDYHYTYLELNPFAVKDGAAIPLDCVARVDDTAAFHCMDKWGALEFPKAFGASKRPEEARVEAIDAKTGASLKLSVLNPDGRIWLMIAGGGASVIYADTVVDLGYMKELANYGEYSGNPSTEDTYEYTKTILDLMTRKADPKGRHKYLIIGGGIANFTDVASTFTGVINAIDEYADALKKVNAKIFVRRGGPNYKTGLAMMKKLGERLGIPMEVYGPDLHMTRVVKLALEEE